MKHPTLPPITNPLVPLVRWLELDSTTATKYSVLKKLQSYTYA